VRVLHGDTDRTPYGWGHLRQPLTVISGGATMLAARKIREKLVVIAGDVLEASPNDIVLQDGNAKVSGTDRMVTIAALARAAYHQTHRFKAMMPGLSETAHYDPPGTFSNACHVAMVEVDVETGRVRVEKFLAVEDAGPHHQSADRDGQVHGGIAQGIGNALFEENRLRRLGNIQNRHAGRLPAADGVRNFRPSNCTISKRRRPLPSRRQGLGEGGAIGAPAAVSMQ